MVFGSLVAALVVVGLAAVAVYTEAIHTPFLDRGFVTPSSAPTASALPPPPCPPDGAVPLAYDQITVSVYNGSTRSGLAGTTADVFASRGFAIGATGNYPPITLPVEVLFGQSGVAAAYTVAAQLQSPRLVLDTREDATVDVVLGADFAGMVPTEEVTLDPATPLVGAKGCVALGDAIADAVPGPTPSPTNTPTGGATDATTDGTDGQG